MNLTTKDFIENLNFEYFESYSFQRKGDFEIYENLLNKYKKDRSSLLEEEAMVFEKLRNSKLYTKDNNFIFLENGNLNETAELIYKSAAQTNVNEKLIEILKTTFVDYDAWMCAPTYRDAILFYDSKGNIVNGLNICFQCSNVIDLNKKEILTDNIAYKKLKEFLSEIGHNIN